MVKIKFKVAGVVNDSVVDGCGLRLVVFVQGCPHHCEECHNQHTWNFDGGYYEDTENIIKMYKKNTLLKGVTLSGGEPFEQAYPMYLIASKIHELGGNTWTYTGYTLKQLILNDDEYVQKLLKETDYLVDGRYEKNLRDLNLNFRGSSNQNIYYQQNNEWKIFEDGEEML